MIAKVGSTYLSKLKKTIKKDGQSMYKDEHPNPVKAVFVREPYSRLLSAYYGKIATHPVWWWTVGKVITNVIRTGGHGTGCYHNVTFAEFIKFFIRSGKIFHCSILLFLGIGGPVQQHILSSYISKRIARLVSFIFSEPLALST